MMHIVPYVFIKERLCTHGSWALVFLMNSYSSRGHVFSCVLTKPQMCILYNNWPDQHLGLCIPGKASVATTVAATDEAARTNALEGLAMSKLSPVTPPHLIRRNNTPTILHGSVGDQAILQPATGNSTGSKSKASRPRHLKRNQRAKKNRLSAAKSKAARPDTTDAATAPVPVSHAVPEVPDASGSDAANEIQPPPETTAAPQQSGPRDGSPASVRTHAYTATADGMPVPASVGQNKASLPPCSLSRRNPRNQSHCLASRPQLPPVKGEPPTLHMQKMKTCSVPTHRILRSLQGPHQRHLQMQMHRPRSVQRHLHAQQPGSPTTKLCILMMLRTTSITHQNTPKTFWIPWLMQKTNPRTTPMALLAPVVARQMSQVTDGKRWKQHTRKQCTPDTCASAEVSRATCQQ